MENTKKTYHVEVDVKDGKMNMSRVCDGFNPLELLGVLAMSQMEIVQQMRGALPKDIEVKRKVILNEDNLRTMDEELCIRAYRLGFQARQKGLQKKNPYGPGDKSTCWGLGWEAGGDGLLELDTEIHELIFNNFVPWRNIPKDNVVHYMEGFRSQYDYNKTNSEPENPYIGGALQTPSMPFEAWDAGFAYYVKLQKAFADGYNAKSGFAYYVKLQKAFADGYNTQSGYVERSTNPHNEPFMNYAWFLGYDTHPNKQAKAFRNLVGGIIERTMNFGESLKHKHSQGYAAFQANVPKEANPYEPIEFIQAWDRGWERAKANKKSGAEHTFDEMRGSEKPAEYYEGYSARCTEMAVADNPYLDSLENEQKKIDWENGYIDADNSPTIRKGLEAKFVDGKSDEWMEGYVAMVNLLIAGEITEDNPYLKEARGDAKKSEDWWNGTWDCSRLFNQEMRDCSKEDGVEFIGLEAIDGFLNETENPYAMTVQPWKHVIWERAYIEASKTMSTYRSIAHDKGFEDASNDIRFNPYKDPMQQATWEEGFKEYEKKD